jgi:hypothetical protein
MVAISGLSLLSTLLRSGVNANRSEWGGNDEDDEERKEEHTKGRVARIQ